MRTPFGLLCIIACVALAQAQNLETDLLVLENLVFDVSSVGGTPSTSGGVEQTAVDEPIQIAPGIEAENTAEDTVEDISSNTASTSEESASTERTFDTGGLCNSSVILLALCVLFGGAALFTVTLSFMQYRLLHQAPAGGYSSMEATKSQSLSPAQRVFLAFIVVVTIAATITVSVVFGLAFSVPPSAPPVGASSTSTSTSTSTGRSATIMQATSAAQAAVGAHNAVRASTGSNLAPMRWSDSLAQSAQVWADACVWQHGGMPAGCGQNLAKGSNWGTYTADTAFTTSVGLWQGESVNYDVTRNTCRGQAMTTTTFAPCGHYTQLVYWSATEVGCGFAPACGMVVCNYRTGQNILNYASYGPLSQPSPSNPSRGGSTPPTNAPPTNRPPTNAPNPGNVCVTTKAITGVRIAVKSTKLRFKAKKGEVFRKTGKSGSFTAVSNARGSGFILTSKLKAGGAC